MPTLLDGVNRVLERTGYIGGDQLALTSLTDRPRQLEINVAIQVWNETVIELYSLCEKAAPTELAESTITLVADQREYDLPSDLVAIRWPLIDTTGGYYIYKYKGSYEDMRASQIQPQNYKGRPYAAVIKPTNKKLYMEFIPQSTEAGSVYDLIYDKDLNLSNPSDQFPFNTNVFNALTAAVVEKQRYYRKNVYDAVIFNRSMAEAARQLTLEIPSNSYLVNEKENNQLNPFE